MATYKTITLTEEEWTHITMAFFTREERLKYLIQSDKVQRAYWECQLEELETLARRLEV